MSEIGCTPYYDCDNADENIIFALRKAICIDANGNVGIRVFSTGEDVIPVADVTGNQLLGTVPEGYMLEITKFTNNGAECHINLGTTALGNDITDDATLLANDVTTLQFNYDPGHTFNVWISFISGTPADLDIVLLIRKS